MDRRDTGTTTVLGAVGSVAGTRGLRSWVRHSLRTLVPDKVLALFADGAAARGSCALARRQGSPCATLCGLCRPGSGVGGERACARTEAGAGAAGARGWGRLWPGRSARPRSEHLSLPEQEQHRQERRHPPRPDVVGRPGVREVKTAASSVPFDKSHSDASQPKGAKKTSKPVVNVTTTGGSPH